MTLTPGQRITYRPQGRGKPVEAVVIGDHSMRFAGMNIVRAWECRKENPTTRGSRNVTIPERWIVEAEQS